MDSPAWAMAEIPGETVVHIEKQTNPHGDPPLLVRQHMEAPRKFIFLTAQVRRPFHTPRNILRTLFTEFLPRRFTGRYNPRTSETC